MGLGAVEDLNSDQEVVGSNSDQVAGGSNNVQVVGDLSNVQAVVRVMQTTVENWLADKILERIHEIMRHPSIWVVLWPNLHNRHHHIQVRAVVELWLLVV